jgi:hypothetical protein
MELMCRCGAKRAMDVCKSMRRTRVDGSVHVCAADSEDFFFLPIVYSFPKRYADGADLLCVYVGLNPFLIFQGTCFIFTLGRTGGEHKRTSARRPGAGDKACGWSKIAPLVQYPPSAGARDRLLAQGLPPPPCQ